MAADVSPRTLYEIAHALTKNERTALYWLFLRWLARERGIVGEEVGPVVRLPRYRGKLWTPDRKVHGTT